VACDILQENQVSLTFDILRVS